MKIKSEGDLKRWVKDQCEFLKVQVNWFEPARGATFGIPDCEIGLGCLSISPIDDLSLFVPVELKFWRRRKDGSLETEMRPSQKRYHRLAFAKGRKTLILFAVKNQNFKLNIIKAVSGKFYPHDNRSDLEAKSMEITNIHELARITDQLWSQ